MVKIYADKFWIVGPVPGSRFDFFDQATAVAGRGSGNDTPVEA
jgi:hypothetical protein